jgi:hypothetical protein
MVGFLAPTSYEGWGGRGGRNPWTKHGTFDWLAAAYVLIDGIAGHV